jgi:subtilase family serine protease
MLPCSKEFSMKRFLTSVAALAVVLAVAVSALAQGRPQHPNGKHRPGRRLPDLTISNVQVTATAARVTVKNQGRAAAGIEAIEMRVFRGGRQITSESLALGAIRPGGSRTGVFHVRGVNLRAPGTRLVFIADDGNQVAEANEANNFRVVNSGVPVWPRPKKL